jgi:hypothetical protein
LMETALRVVTLVLTAQRVHSVPTAMVVVRIA